MSDIIQLLPDSVANQIAAGEVIQRPASVIKELVENAIDADAKTINVVVVEAGKTSIQVIDDGKGMSETDARLSFERHATSKIRKADDLFALRTMGFRGEALASIAAVAQVELRTRLRDEEVGTHLSLAGCKVTGQEPCSCPTGSNFLVENLFFNVPARRKFLKSNTTELNNIVTAFQRIALVYPHIRFTLQSNTTELLHLREATLKQRIVDIFGKRINGELLPLDVETSLCRITGFVGKPEAAKKKGAHQYFFVNGRYMKHAYFNKAVMTAYERLVPVGEQVPYFLYFEVDPETIDVNIHPTKTEIKFDNEQSIWQILLAAVREAVGKFNDVPTIDFDTDGRPDIPVFDGGNLAAAPRVQYNPDYNPFKETPMSSLGSRRESKGERYVESKMWSGQDVHSKAPEHWEQLFAPIQSGTEGTTQGEHTLFDATDKPADTVNDLVAEKSPSHYQYKGKYIMNAVKSGLMIIDQHRAHVRVLYDQYLVQLAAHKSPSQKVLFPEVVQFSAAEAVVLPEVLPELQELGFELTDLGGNSYSVNATPAGLEGLQVDTLIHDMVASTLQKEGRLKDDIDRALALSLARHAAIPHGQVLSNDEMENLVNQLFASTNPNHTPDGKTVLCILKQNEIERLLG